MIRFNGKTEMTNNIRAPVNIPMDCTKDHLIYSRSKFSDLCIVSNFNCLMQDLKEKEKFSNSGVHETQAVLFTPMIRP